MAGNPTPPGRNPPEISPYVVSVLLVGFGLWCFFDGWVSKSAEMQDHLLFNRIASTVLIPWGIWDFLRVRKRKKEEALEPSTNSPESP